MDRGFSSNRSESLGSAYENPFVTIIRSSKVYGGKVAGTHLAMVCVEFHTGTANGARKENLARSIHASPEEGGHDPPLDDGLFDSVSFVLNVE